MFLAATPSGLTRGLLTVRAKGSGRRERQSAPQQGPPHMKQHTGLRATASVTDATIPQRPIA